MNQYVSGTTTHTHTDTPDTDNFSYSYAMRYSGPDSGSNARIGGGWTHNYDVTASYTGNGGKGLGNDYGIEASAAISTLWTLFDVARWELGDPSLESFPCA